MFDISPAFGDFISGGRADAARSGGADTAPPFGVVAFRDNSGKSVGRFEPHPKVRVAKSESGDFDVEWHEGGVLTVEATDVRAPKRKSFQDHGRTA